jgi:hypothetical protein
MLLVVPKGDLETVLKNNSIFKNLTDVSVHKVQNKPLDREVGKMPV